MTDLAIDTHTGNVKVNVVQVGKDKVFMELDGGLADALIERFGGAGKKVTANGKEVKRGDRLQKDDEVFVQPRAVKQGS